MITGHPDGYASATYGMSGSVQIGSNWSYSTNNNMMGAHVTFAYPAGVSVGRMRQRGFVVQNMAEGTVISNIGTVVGGWYQHAFHNLRAGQIDADVDNSTNAAISGSLSAFWADNRSTGTYGASAGYGLWLKGFGKHYLSGYVGIKDTTPSYELDVTGTIRATGNIIAYSDVRHKENIETVDNAIQIINDLRGVRFNWSKKYQEGKDVGGTYNSKPINQDALEKRQIGLIAQEVQEVLPELVSEDGKGFLSVNYANLVAVLVEANKEQQKLIEDLQNRVEKLEAK
jgi:hypothetical protein